MEVYDVVLEGSDLSWTRWSRSQSPLCSWRCGVGAGTQRLIHRLIGSCGIGGCRCRDELVRLFEHHVNGRGCQDCLEKHPREGGGKSVHRLAS
jgi:hypothetical protein